MALIRIQIQPENPIPAQTSGERAGTTDETWKRSEVFTKPEFAQMSSRTARIPPMSAIMPSGVLRMGV